MCRSYGRTATVQLRRRHREVVLQTLTNRPLNLPETLYTFREAPDVIGRLLSEVWRSNASPLGPPASKRHSPPHSVPPLTCRQRRPKRLLSPFLVPGQRKPPIFNRPNRTVFEPRDGQRHPTTACNTVIHLDGHKLGHSYGVSRRFGQPSGRNVKTTADGGAILALGPRQEQVSPTRLGSRP
jgi:hypothetical protein